ncbi:tryptophan synthase subunit alpha [Streptomyces solaniscabiei]|uniref:tryptophan synthase subunit alpha n=1 Tax=Streptomyces solaniscabiei TaxID=2683255 RepID=UPI001CE3141F|nr:tryptophan synthase subunit alpha [Streptomyces solaniscabiei]
MTEFTRPNRVTASRPPGSTDGPAATWSSQGRVSAAPGPDVGPPVLGAFSVAGYPDVLASAEALITFASSGAGLLEVGVPAVDPWLDGPVIGTAHEIALRSGDGVATAIATVRLITAETAQPVYCMAYWRTVHSFGLWRFAHQLAAAGATGCLVADVPARSHAAWVSAAASAGLAAPLLVNRDAQHEETAAMSRAATGFVYTPAAHGQPTGHTAGIELPALRSFVGTVRHAAPTTPVLAGIGVATPALASAVVAQCHVDGVVIGSPLVRALSEGGLTRAAELVGQFVGSIEAAQHR